MRIAFIGGGVMAQAIISGVKDAGLDASIIVGEPVEVRRESLKNDLGVEVTASNGEAIAGADIVVLSVKPQQLDAVAEDLKGVLTADQTVLSIMAGVKMHSIGLKLNHTKLIRVMPNTPAQIRKGISAWMASDDVDQSTLDFVASMLRAIGDELKFDDEKSIDIATALSGSGPGYVFVFIEALADAGVELGLPVHVARHLASQTVFGSAALQRESGKHPAELRNMVTSPGGTTAAGLAALEIGGFRAAVAEAVRTAFERGEELAGGK
ncbi:MAG: pyrroline-5-carboxylate reductase [Chloroflexi bacterium]|nr:pyrroline-5-carboxylate reductase [Chloroflexota bacterium]MCI0809698.1 pyrroline-5-carboxylate reductase [Chloroflexota bacterium]MCI0837267.1 pyrroline-5-carboxylate reductase [Chloroflexota bacterium]